MGASPLIVCIRLDGIVQSLKIPSMSFPDLQGCSLNPQIRIPALQWG